MGQRGRAVDIGPEGQVAVFDLGEAGGVAEQLERCRPIQARDDGREAASLVDVLAEQNPGHLEELGRLIRKKLKEQEGA